MYKKHFRVKIVKNNKLQRTVRELETQEYQIKVQTQCIILAEVLRGKLLRLVVQTIIHLITIIHQLKSENKMDHLYKTINLEIINYKLKILKTQLLSI